MNRKILAIGGGIFLIIAIGILTNINNGLTGHTITLKEAIANVGGGVKVGTTAPDFTFTNLQGQKEDLNQVLASGKPVLLYFMATWCPECKQDLHTLEGIYGNYSSNVEVVTYSITKGEDQAIINNYKQNYPNLTAVSFNGYEPLILNNYNVVYTTSKYAIGRNGKIMYDGSTPFTLNQWKILLDALNKSQEPVSTV